MNIAVKFYHIVRVDYSESHKMMVGIQEIIFSNPNFVLKYFICIVNLDRPPLRTIWLFWWRRHLIIGGIIFSGFILGNLSQCSQIEALGRVFAFCNEIYKTIPMTICQWQFGTILIWIFVVRSDWLAKWQNKLNPADTFLNWQKATAIVNITRRYDAWYMTTVPTVHSNNSNPFSQMKSLFFNHTVSLKFVPEGLINNKPIFEEMIA